MSKPQEEEFAELIQEHSGILFKVIHLYVDHEEDRRDLYQEILIQVWKSFKRFKGQSKFSTWLYRVALNTTLTFQKKEQKRRNLPAPDMEVIPDEGGSDMKDMLYRLVKQLTEIDRMIMTLHLDSYSNKEIAAITGMTTNHINVKLHRLKGQIIEQLKKYTNGSH